MSEPSLRHLRYWPSWIAVGLIRGLGFLPYPLLWLFGTGLGHLAYLFAWGRRRIARRNLELCFPEWSPAERERVLRRNFGLMGQALVSQGVNWGISHQRLQRLVRLRNREHLDRIRAEGRPFIILAPHFLGMELAGIALSALVMPGVTLYQRIRNRVFDHQVRLGRTQFGSLTVERHADLLGLVRLVRGGRFFYYLPDQDPGRRRGIFVPFFGIPTATVPVLSRFARLTQAAVIPACACLLPRGGGLELIIAPPLEAFPSDDPVADTRLMNRVIEEAVREMPEQYFWVHRRFKTRPPGEPSLYL